MPPRRVRGLFHCDFGQKAVAVLGYRLDIARAAGVIAQGPAQCTNALGQRFVGNRDAAPDLVHETGLRHQGSGIGDQQGKRIEIATAKLDRITPAPQLAVRQVELEIAEMHVVRFPLHAPPFDHAL